jgi:hypothetical protein
VIRGTSYYAVAESRRDDDGRTKTIYFRRLGKLTEPEVKRWRFILSGDSHSVPSEFIDLQEDTECYHSWRHGVSCLVSSLWEKLGFSSIISESLSRVPNKSFVAKIIEAMVVNRLEDPCSKLGLLEWLEKDTSLQFISCVSGEYQGPNSLLKTTPSPESRNIWAAQQAVFESRDFGVRL